MLSFGVWFSFARMIPERFRFGNAFSQNCFGWRLSRHKDHEDESQKRAQAKSVAGSAQVSVLFRDADKFIGFVFVRLVDDFLSRSFHIFFQIGAALLLRSINPRSAAFVRSLKT